MLVPKTEEIKILGHIATIHNQITPSRKFWRAMAIFLAGMRERREKTAGIIMEDFDELKESIDQTKVALFCRVQRSATCR